jgi:hypothetical protein
MTNFTEIRGQSMQVDYLSTTNRPTGDDCYEGRIYFDTTLGEVCVYVGSAWRCTNGMTTTSTSTTSTSTSSTSTTSSSTSTTSTSTTSTSSSTSSTSTSTTLF